VPSSRSPRRIRNGGKVPDAFQAAEIRPQPGLSGERRHPGDARPAPRLRRGHRRRRRAWAGLRVLPSRYHGIRNVAVLEKGYLAGGNTARNTTTIRSNYITPEGSLSTRKASRCSNDVRRARLQRHVLAARPAHARPHGSDAAQFSHLRAEMGKHHGHAHRGGRPEGRREDRSASQHGLWRPARNHRRPLACRRRHRASRCGRLGLCRNRRHGAASRSTSAPRSRASRSPATASPRSRPSRGTHRRRSGADRHRRHELRRGADGGRRAADPLLSASGDGDAASEALADTLVSSVSICTPTWSSPRAARSSSAAARTPTSSIPRARRST
jgi:hypothetical protein